MLDELIEQENMEHYHLETLMEYSIIYEDKDCKGFEMEEHHLVDDWENRMINLEFDSLVFTI